MKKANDRESREYWRFVEGVAREVNAIKCDVCGATPTLDRAIYARGKQRLCDAHFAASAPEGEQP